MHWTDEDMGESTIIARSTLRKFTAVDSTWSLHNFVESPSQDDLAGNFPGMNPAPFTELSSKNGPNRAEKIICTDNTHRSLSFIDGDTFLMLPNHPALRDALKTEFTLEFWLRHHQGQVSDIGFFEWFSSMAGEEHNVLFRFYLDRIGSAWRPRVVYEHGNNIVEDNTASAHMLVETENSASSHTLAHHIAVVARDNAGTREFDFYRDGAFLETVVAGTLPTGGEESEHVRFGNAATNTSGNADIDWVRFSNVARTAPEILETYDRGAPDCDAAPPVVPGDPPVVSNVIPQILSQVIGDATLQFDVTDPDGDIHDLWLYAIFTTAGTHEMIHDGENSFAPYYLQSSRREAITNGWRYTLRRVGGWPESPQIRIRGFDTKLNPVQ
jgi:hypothetical protein